MATAAEVPQARLMEAVEAREDAARGAGRLQAAAAAAGGVWGGAQNGQRCGHRCWQSAETRTWKSVGLRDALT